MRSKTMAIVCAALMAGAVISGCGSESGSGGKTKLTIGLFGNFGYTELLKEYASTHPDIEIQDRTASYSDHHKNLAAHLATNNGAADIEAVDTGYVAQFKATSDKFVDLNTKGGDQLKDRWLPWKWAASLSKEGQQIGYGTDVGGLAICYRRDLLEAAGLPSERTEVAALWPTWPDFMAAGKQFQANAPEGVKWFDGGPTVLNAIVGQAATGYYDQSDRITVGSNPELKQGWDLVADAVNSGLSAKLLYSTPVWNTGFKQGQFATVTCPAWQMAKIKDQAPDTAGKWDVTSVPGGGGNWGGSYLTIPKQGKNVDKAVELAAWLTAPEQQAKVFASAGLLPSTPKLYEDPAVVGLQNPFFNNAPVGKLFTDAAKQLQPQYQGPKAGDVQTAIGNAMQRVEQGKQSGDDSWNQFVGDVQNLSS
ncbi:ABC transporter substrate-binding protein [Amycolatopsis magusensis]|uniref:Cellobiose transport system substrate-binding protein n=1 Tax=Amycolatopsis magusensis TaxID=882444 RepID=A0ABS4Q2W8_9PSEU|nr:extracellular solute-binding protein [Amycolatopsis magusensis]MBP2185424.1 cellobiose transport system substrate-binding protein [Amycolatopsis magusensis]MDI5977863.1 extracellular solute-binding protein [Amycolatopsis magusensis]